jgi:hypothetical protein
MKLKTDKIALGILALYGVYGVFAIPFVYLMLSLAIGLIVYSTSDSIEFSVVAVLLTGVLSVLISQTRRPEGFVDGGAMISKRVASIRRPQAKAPIGVYASGFVEGFSDLSDNPVPTEKKPEAPTAATAAAPTASTVASTVAAATAATAPSTSATTSSTSQPAAVTKSGFKDSNSPNMDGLFKLGSIPQDTKGGFHIDQGTTVLNALNALQPDQVKRMSEDTQKLIDTQKSLMMMLGTMKPMLSDGKQLIDTFQTMFGPGASGAMGASGASAPV